MEYTKYERARILGARALQLAMNAPLLINIPKEKLEEVSYDPLKIAEIEFNADILPITVKRPFPKRGELEEEKEGEGIEVEEEIKTEEVKPEKASAIEIEEPEEQPATPAEPEEFG